MKEPIMDSLDIMHDCDVEPFVSTEDEDEEENLLWWTYYYNLWRDIDRENQDKMDEELL